MYRFSKFVAGPLLRLLFQPWIRGAENIPETGPAILASNHLAVIDSVFLPLMSKREITFVGKSDYFTGAGLKGWITKHFMQSVGVIPVDRSGGKASQVALDKGLQVLERGGLFGIYPEGTRSPDGRLYRGKTGIARLSLISGAPIIPVAMVGTNKSQPIGKTIPKPERIGVIVGKPLDFSRYKGMENNRYVLRSITDEVMYDLMLLSGQEYVDEYAANVKKRLEIQRKAGKGTGKDSEISASETNTPDNLSAQVHPDETPQSGNESQIVSNQDN